MEWLKKLLEGAKVTDGKIDVDSLVTAINKESPKYMVPKDTFNNINDQLKNATKTIEDLKKNNGDNEELQKTIATHKKLLQDKENEFALLKKEGHLKDEYRKAGAKEEYLELLMKTSKLDEIVEVNGEFVGADKAIQASLGSYKDLFNAQSKSESDEDSNKGTYVYEPGDGNSNVGSANFLDIITENQVKR